MSKPKPAAPRRGKSRPLPIKLKITVTDNDACPLCHRVYSAAERPPARFGAVIDERMLAYQKLFGNERLDAEIARQIDAFKRRYFGKRRAGR